MPGLGTRLRQSLGSLRLGFDWEGAGQRPRPKPPTPFFSPRILATSFGNKRKGNNNNNIIRFFFILDAHLGLTPQIDRYLLLTMFIIVCNVISLCN